MAAPGATGGGVTPLLVMGGGRQRGLEEGGERNRMRKHRVMRKGIESDMS